MSDEVFDPQGFMFADEFTVRLIEFLKGDGTGRVRSDGGYAPVSQEDLYRFRRLVILLQKMRWMSDPDGHYPLDIDIMRKVAGRTIKTVVPHFHRCSLEELEQARDNLINDMDNLTSELRKLAQIIRAKKRNTNA